MWPGVFLRSLASWLFSGMCLGLATTWAPSGPTATWAPWIVPTCLLVFRSTTGAGSFLVLPWITLSVTVPWSWPTTVPSVPTTSAVTESLSLLLVIVPSATFTLCGAKVTVGGRPPAVMTAPTTTAPAITVDVRSWIRR